MPNKNEISQFSPNNAVNKDENKKIKPILLGNPGIVNDPLGRFRVPPIFGVNFVQPAKKD